jgi:hypothetical protein
MSPLVRIIVALVAGLATAPLLNARDAGPSGLIWEDRGDLTKLDLLIGSGTAREPGVDFRFVGESSTGTSPKFDVVDEHGARWKVKLGEEVRSETAAARLLWAAGYMVDEDYYRPHIRVRDLKRLTRGQQFVSADGVVTGARLERPSSSVDEDTWSWYDNPFIGTREFNGLRVMMAVINNWDLKTVNNVRSLSPTSRIYRISDLGATFGRTGDVRTRSKGVATDYANSPFVDTVTATHVNFVLHSRPFLLTVFHMSNYRSRTQMESIAKQVPLGDARWIGNRLAQLSAEQLGDCFRAGGFAAADVEIYTRVLLTRIAALTTLTTGARLLPAHTP